MSAIVNIILEILRALREQASDYIRDLSKNPLQKTRQTLNTLTLLWMLLYGISPYPSPQQQIEQQLGTIERKMEEEPEEAKYGYSWLYRIYNMYRFLHVQPVWVSDSVFAYILSRVVKTLSDSITLLDITDINIKTVVSRSLTESKITLSDSLSYNFGYIVEETEIINGIPVVLKQHHFIYRLLLSDSVSKVIIPTAPLTFQEALSLSELLNTITAPVTKSTFSESLSLSEIFNVTTTPSISRVLSELFTLSDEVLAKKRVPEYPEAEYKEILLSDYLSSLDEIDPKTFLFKQVKTLVFSEILGISDSGGTGYPYPEEPTKTYMQYKFAETVTLSDSVKVPVEILTTVAQANVVPATVRGFRRAIARTSNGILFIGYRKKVDSGIPVFVKKSIDGGRTWTDEVQLSETGYLAGAPAIVTDYKDHVHVSFNAFGSAHPNNLALYHAEYDGVSWKVQRITGSDFTNVYESSLAIDLSGHLHLVFLGINPNVSSYRIVYHMIYDGKSWSEPQPIPGINVNALTPSIAVDSQNRVHLVFGGPGIYYSVFDGSSWSTPIKIHSGFASSMCIDHNDVIHVVFQGRSSSYSYYQIWYCKYNGAWSSPIRISTASGMENVDQEYPSIAPDSKGRLHVVWYDANYKMWYCKYDSGWKPPTELIEGITGQAVSIGWYNFPSWNRIIDKLKIAFTDLSVSPREVKFLSRPIE